MPLTPFHLGPSLFLGVLTLKFLNLWGILLGSIIMDLEPLILIFVRKCYYCPHHGFFHSILGAIFGSLILAFVLFLLKDKLDRISSNLKIKQSFSFKTLFFSCLLSWLLHIFFDSLTHYDVFPFWPSLYNPFLTNRLIYWPINFVFLVFGIIAFFLFRKKIKDSFDQNKKII
mgnify:CR=1 FL=1